MAAATTVYVAHHPYDAEKEDELTLEVGDVINVSDSSDPGWWVGERVKDGKAGWFPSNFVDPYEQPAETSAPHPEPVADAPAPATAPAVAATEEAAPAPPKHEGPVLARVEYDYEAKESGELSLEVGRVVTILDSSDPAWWTGDLNGKVGTFPSNYVKLLEHKEETEGSGDKPVKFKLAAFGVKQGGLGSLFAGGVVPGLKKTGLKKVGGLDTGAQALGASKRSSMDEPRSPVVHAAPPKVAPPVAEEVLAPLVNPTAVRAAPPPTPVVPVEQVASPEPRVPSRAKKPKVKQIKALVLYDYTAQEDDEISLVKGATIVVTDKMGDEGWWSGRCDNGDAGNFPSDFVQEIKEEPTQSPTVAPDTPTPAPAPVPIAIPATTSVAEATPKSPVHSRPPIHAPVPLPSIPVEPIRTDLPRSRTDPPLATPPAFPRGSRPPSMIASPTQPHAQVHEARPLNEGPPLPGSPPPKRLSMVSRSSSHDFPASPRHTNAPAIPEPSSPISTHSTHGDLSRSSTTSRRPHKPVPEAPLQEAEEEESHTPAVEEMAASTEAAPVTPNRSSYILPTPVSRNRPLPPLARPPSIHQMTENNRRSVVIPPSTHLPSVPSESEETVQESHAIQEEKDESAADAHHQQQHEEVPQAASETLLAEAVEQKEISEEPVAQDEPAITHHDEQVHEAEEAKVHQEAGIQEVVDAPPAVPADVAETEQDQQEQGQEQEEEEEEGEVAEAVVEEEKEPEKPKLPEIESSGPTLSHASRPRPAKGRKPPSAPVPNAETSFVSQLEADVKAAPIVEEKKPDTPSSVEKVAPPPPPKPIKPIFQKFPTPFAGAQPLNVTLRPTGRRAGSSNDAPQSPGGHGGETTSLGGAAGGAGATPATATVPPAGGVKSLSSRFGQFQGVPASGGGNSAALELEIAKLRRWMTEELDRVKKELSDERESREKLQEEVNQLKAQLQG
ncbi:SH3-domain kinase binding protein 1 [Mortierella antarctica]|nr:SH3-domain kinase binding protein 1 [Mortierella antarctica]